MSRHRWLRVLGLFYAWSVLAWGLYAYTEYSKHVPRDEVSVRVAQAALDGLLWPYYFAIGFASGIA